MSKQHSQIISLVRQSYGTANANEAASFLSSAIGRALKLDKETRRDVIAEALSGVNLNRASEAPKTKPQTKTVYKDTPETERRLQSYIRQVADLQREIDALKANRADPAEIKRLTARVEALTKEAVSRERQHLEELAMARATVQQDTAETEQLRQKVEELTGRIDRLKFALSEMATGNDGEMALRQDAERRLESALSDLKRAQAAYNEAEEARQVTQRLLDQADAQAERLTAKTNDLQFRMNQQETRHNDELKEEQGKRKAAARRAEDAERETTRTKAKLKFEEYNTRQVEKQRDALNLRIDELTAAASKHEDDARHNYYECESLNAKLALAQVELIKLRKYKEQLFGVFHRSSSYVALTVSIGLMGMIFLNNQQGILSDVISDAMAAGFMSLVASYGIAYAIFKGRER